MDNSLRLTVGIALLAASDLPAATLYVPAGGSIQQAVTRAALSTCGRAKKANSYH
jgi:hypothetical protein